MNKMYRLRYKLCGTLVLFKENALVECISGRGNGRNIFLMLSEDMQMTYVVDYCGLADITDIIFQEFYENHIAF